MSIALLLVAEESERTHEAETILRDDLGYTILRAHNGADALKLAGHTAERPRAVFASLNISDMPSLMMVHLLHQSHHDIPIVAMANSSTEPQAIDAIHRGAIDYVMLPTNKTRLRATAENALHIAALRESLKWSEENVASQSNVQRAGQTPPPLSLLDESGNVNRMSVMEREIIKAALLYHEGQVSLVARQLGIGRSTLYRKMDQYELHGMKEHM